MFDRFTDPAADPIPEESLRRVHRAIISDRSEVLRILDCAHRNQSRLTWRVDQLGEDCFAEIRQIGSFFLRLEVNRIAHLSGMQLGFILDLSSGSYFFRSEVIAWHRLDHVVVEIPSRLYEIERRSAQRHSAEDRVAEARVSNGDWSPVRIANRSASGIAIDIPDQCPASPGDTIQLRKSAGDAKDALSCGVVRHISSNAVAAGWKRVGVGALRSGSSRLIPIEQIDPPLRREEARHSESNSATAVSAACPIELRVVDYRNANGERIRAILDSTDGRPGGSAVIIPPAWGRTKETLLPLARTIVSTFRAINERVTVLRFDGVRRRGESHADAECLEVGREYLRFTVSQAVADIDASLEYLFANPELNPSRVALVTPSVSAVEARRAILGPAGERVDAWISLVGVTDLQTALRKFSGGIDYGQAWIDGIQLGKQELLGVLCDMDTLARDAVESRLWFREDAKSDFALLRVPITWIIGKHDAWTRGSDVQALLSNGQADNRRIVELPTGHRLRDGRSAAFVFGLVAEELARLLTGKSVHAVQPERNDIEQRTRLERRRLPVPGINLRRFWSDYLVGRRGEIGIELLADTPAYRSLMKKQIELLNPSETDSVVDLGAGVGQLSIQLTAEGVRPRMVALVDIALKGLLRARHRLRYLSCADRCPLIVADLDNAKRSARVPFADSAFDLALLSLLVSYVEDAESLLGEVRRVLRPGGRVVVSSIMKDADLSKIYIDSLDDLALGHSLQWASGERELRSLRQDFLNDASRILDFEEFGVFRFYEPEQLSDLLERAGFTDVEVHLSFGEPPQAAVAVGRT